MTAAVPPGGDPPPGLPALDGSPEEAPDERAEAAAYAQALRRAAERAWSDAVERAAELTRDTEEWCAVLERDTEERCAELERRTRRRCDEMRREAEQWCADLQRDTERRCEEMLAEVERECAARRAQGEIAVRGGQRAAAAAAPGPLGTGARQDQRDWAERLEVLERAVAELRDRLRDGFDEPGREAARPAQARGFPMEPAPAETLRITRRAAAGSPDPRRPAGERRTGT